MAVLLSEENRRTLDIFFANRLSVVGLCLVVSWLIIAIVGPAIAPYGHNDQSTAERLQGPDSKHWLGTDWMGRDVLSGILWGAHTTIFWGLMPIVIALAVGVPTGALAGYRGGWPASLIMRLSDLFLSVPALLLAVAITAALRPSIVNAMLAVSVVWWPWYTRLVQAQTLSLKEEAFVEAAEGLGASTIRVMFRHILPNCMSALLVRSSLDFGFSVLYMAGLGFIGLGAQPPSPEWGLAVASGRSYMPEHWWISVFPGLALLTLVLGFNLMGDAIRDAFDPEIRGR